MHTPFQLASSGAVLFLDGMRGDRVVYHDITGAYCYRESKGRGTRRVYIQPGQSVEWVRWPRSPPPRRSA